MLIALGVVAIVLTSTWHWFHTHHWAWHYVKPCSPAILTLRQSPLLLAVLSGLHQLCGAHRLLDKGISGKEHIKEVSSAANRGIIVVGIMRYVLFLAIFGVVASGVTIDLSSHNANPASQAFWPQPVMWACVFFGIVLWAAALSSVVGAAWTSVSFISVFRPGITERQRNIATLIFIAFTLVVYLCGYSPAALLVFAGGFNGLVLPQGLTLFLWVGWRRADLMDGYRYPRWLLWLGMITCIMTGIWPSCRFPLFLIS